MRGIDECSTQMNADSHTSQQLPYDAGIKIVWKRRNVGYFVDLYREYMEDMNRVIAGFG